MKEMANNIIQKPTKNNNMTAVEWLAKQYEKWSHEGHFIPKHLVEQALEMEKQQIIDAHGIKRTKITAKKIISFPIIGFGIGLIPCLTLEDLYLKLIFSFISVTCLLIGLILLIDKKK